MLGATILIVDDEPAIRFAVRDFLTAHGFQVAEADTCQAAEGVFRAARPDAVILDYMLPDGDALALLPRLKAIDAEVPITILTAHGTIDLAVHAIKEGAEQFLTKPLELPTLLIVLQRLLENRRTRKKQLAGAARRDRVGRDPFLGGSPAIRALGEQAHKICGADSPVLIQGETGSGKGVLAAWLHANSPRADEAFVDLNCAGLAREFLETELFGHEKGAFTGAVAAKPGLLDIADHGVVFLDEIGDMDLQVQPKLLKVLEEKRFRRLGSVGDRQVDIRLVSATHQDLVRLVQENRFRSDLYFRISTIPLVVPPLRQRVDDIPVLARHLLATLAADLGRGRVEVSADAEAALAAYPWPGNIRELRNVLERAVLLSQRDTLRPEDLRFAPSTPTAAPDDAALTLSELEQRHIERVLAAEDGNVGTAAKRLGLPKSSLYQKIKKYGIQR